MKTKRIIIFVAAVLLVVAVAMRISFLYGISESMKNSDGKTLFNINSEDVDHVEIKYYDAVKTVDAETETMIIERLNSGIWTKRVDLSGNDYGPLSDRILINYKDGKAEEIPFGENCIYNTHDHICYVFDKGYFKDIYDMTEELAPTD